MRDFRKQKVWAKSHRLTLKVYKITATFPRQELYGLTSQIRRACASIPTNIAEGCGRGLTWISHDFFKLQWAQPRR